MSPCLKMGFVSSLRIHLPATAGAMGLIPGQKDPLEKEMAATPVFLPGKARGQRAWRAAQQSRAQLSDRTTTPGFHFVSRAACVVFLFIQRSHIRGHCAVCFEGKIPNSSVAGSMDKNMAS